MSVKFIGTPDSPAPAGHYSQAVEANGFIFVSGQLPVDIEKGRMPDLTVKEQTMLVLGNCEKILKSAGSGLDRVVKVTVYVTDIGLWGEVNEIYADVFGTHRPARAVVPVPDLHHGFKIEIDMIAIA